MKPSTFITLFAVALLACSCQNTPIAPIEVPTPLATPRTPVPTPAPVSAPSFSEEPSAANRDDIRIVRLDLDPRDDDDPLRQIRLPKIKLANATLDEAMTLVARASGVPFQLYSEGLQPRPVNVDISEGMTLRDAVSDLCRQANCYYAYYIDQIDRRVVAGVKITRKPFRSYGAGQLGKLQVIHS